MNTRTSEEKALIGSIRQLSALLDPIPTDTAPVLVRMAGVRAVIFDVYGTLFVSGSGDIDPAMASSPALDNALADAGFQILCVDCAQQGLASFLDLIRKEHQVLKANGVEYPEVDVREIWHDCLTAMKTDGRIAGDITPDIIMRLAVGYECRANPVWPMPGMAETLAGLRKSGFSLGIVSNAQFYTPLLFDALIGCSPEDMGFEPALTTWSYLVREAKPSVRIFQDLICEAKIRFGLLPHEMLYVGNDMLNDILPAHTVGMRTALFAGDRRSLRKREDRSECRAMAPDVVLGGLKDLFQVLGPGQNQCAYK